MAMCSKVVWEVCFEANLTVSLKGKMVIEILFFNGFESINGHKSESLLGTIRCWFYSLKFLLNP